LNIIDTVVVIKSKLLTLLFLLVFGVNRLFLTTVPVHYETCSSVLQGEKLVYGCGRTVIIRGVQNPLSAELYTEHPKDVTVAKISPSGFYCASGDAGGLVKIWSTDNPEHPVKFEGQVLAGSVMDLQWSPDSQLVVAVGEGRECFGKVFAWDTGAFTRSSFM
jgi:WD40 repeat protein